jgi:hypothetical protein
MRSSPHWLFAGLIITAGQWSITNFSYGEGTQANFPGSVSEPIDSAKPVKANGTLP